MPKNGMLENKIETRNIVILTNRMTSLKTIRRVRLSYNPITLNTNKFSAMTVTR
jgi:hypothetical protein